MTSCDQCGAPMKEQALFGGCYVCPCGRVHLTPQGAADFERELHTEHCRHQGMTFDVIIASWNKTHPGDEW